MPGETYDMIRLDCPRCGAPLEMKEEILICQYCGARLILRRSAAGQSRPVAGSAPDSGVTVSGLTLAPFAYYEPQSGLEVFTILVPRGWQVNGGVAWLPQRPAAPAQLGMQISNPNGLEAFEAFPTVYFTWTNNPMIQMTKPAGSLYFGFEVQQPMPASNALHQYVLPRYRNIPDLRVIDEGPATELLQAFSRNQGAQAQGGQYSADSVRARLHYTASSQPIAEEISGVAEYTRLSAPGMFGSTESIYWNMGYLTAFRASRDHLESYADLYRTMITSIKINPAWNSFVQQVIQGLSSNTIRGIQQIGDLSRQISRNYDEISAMNLQGWQERSAAYDRVSEQFSQTIRGVDPYFDPNTGQNVELPSGYTQAWSTPLGEYILSDDPNFNPNTGSNQTWTPLVPPKQ